MGKYDAIINLPHRQSSKRPHMSVHDRAAQFAPFAALTGYGEEVAETARLTDRQIELTEEQMELLNARLLLIKNHLDKRPSVQITFFIPDDKKTGGRYQEVSGVIRRIDSYKKTIEMEFGDSIPIDNIISIVFIHARQFTEYD